VRAAQLGRSLTNETSAYQNPASAKRETTRGQPTLDGQITICHWEKTREKLGEAERRSRSSQGWSRSGWARIGGKRKNRRSLTNETSAYQKSKSARAIEWIERVGDEGVGLNLR
jgi:hypothetical protein